MDDWRAQVGIAFAVAVCVIAIAFFVWKHNDNRINQCAEMVKSGAPANSIPRFCYGR